MTNDVYTKRGVTIRLEWTPQSRSLIEIEESGDARYDGGTFVARATAPLPGEGRRATAPALERFAGDVAALVGPEFRLDRLVVAAGSSTHALEAGGELRTWSDSNARCFASISLPDIPLQVEVDLGASRLETVDLSPLGNAAAALRNFHGDMTPPRRLRLTPLVSAALLRALVPRLLTGRNARVRQATHPDFLVDGTGRAIEPHLGPPWPNAYRPSYRNAPLVTPFHLDLETAPASPGSDAVAVALLEPFRVVGDRLVAVALCAAENAAFRCIVSHTAREWLDATEGAGAGAIWFPFGAGSWGRDVSLAF